MHPPEVERFEHVRVDAAWVQLQRLFDVLESLRDIFDFIVGFGQASIAARIVGTRGYRLLRGLFGGLPWSISLDHSISLFQAQS